MREEGSYKNISNAAARTWIAVGTRAGRPQGCLETNVLFRGLSPYFPMGYSAPGIGLNSPSTGMWRGGTSSVSSICSLPAWRSFSGSGRRLS